MGINLPLQAEWGRTAEDYIRLHLPGEVHICSDGSGGCWATGEGVRLSHVDRYGDLTWGDEVLRIPPEYGFHQKPVLADNGDVIIAYDVFSDDNDTIPDIYLQRVNLDQELLWGNNGIPLDTSHIFKGVTGVYRGPVDDTYLIKWGRVMECGIRLQLVNGDGDFLWGVDGIELNRYPSRGYAWITLSSDRFIMAAYSTEADDEGDMNVLKINSDGEILWSEKYAIVTETLRRKRLRDIESDRAGGAILIYESDSLESVDDSVRYYGIKAMRISGDGDSLWTRQLYEREVLRGSETFGYISPIMNYAGEGHFLIAWADYPHSFQVVALDIDGEYLWEEPVDVILTQVGYGSLDAVDSHDGVCYVWREADDRENGSIVQQWGQRISVEGERLWGDRGRAIQAKTVWYSTITTDGNGGVITVVTMAFPTIQMINRNGEIGVVLETPVVDDNDKRKSTNLSPQLFIYPNPGNSTTMITYILPFASPASLQLYDLSGREIRTLVEGNKQAGVHQTILNATDMPSGLYFVRLRASDQVFTQKVMLIR